MKNEDWSKVGECLYRYKNGAYYGLVKVGGKQVKKKLDAADLPQAKRALLDFRRDAAKLNTGADKKSLAELLDFVLVNFKKNQAKNSIDAKTYLVSRLKREIPNVGKKLDKVKSSEIESCLAGFKSDTHYRQAKYLLKQCFRLAESDGLLLSNPMGKLPKRKKEGRKLYSSPTWEDFSRIVENAREHASYRVGEESANMIDFMGRAGLGQAEASQVDWSDISWEANEIKTFRWKTKTDFTFPIYPWLRSLLERLHDASGNPKRGKLFTIRDPQEAMVNACNRLGLPVYRPRALRRMFIIRCIEQGVPIPIIAGWQGHQDSGVTLLKNYAHIQDRLNNKFAEKLIG